jgi:hypothetical protein
VEPETSTKLYVIYDKFYEGRICISGNHHCGEGAPINISIVSVTIILIITDAVVSNKIIHKFSVP